jgi:hypothetical protein
VPTYNFFNTKTEETTTEFLWVSELDAYLVSNPDLVVMPPDTSAQVDSWRMGRKKPDEGFREILKGIKRYYKGSTVET